MMKIREILHRKKKGAMWMHLLLFAAMANGQWTVANGQVIIGGNVYGGGNQGDLGGSTAVTVRSCVIQGDVYGGARMANIGKRTFVNIDGENASDTLYITTVYGGNDIAGTIGSAIESTDTLLDQVPSELEYVLRGTEKKADHPEKNFVNNTWNAFIRTSKMATEDKTHRLIVGRLFGGGNGDYNYSTGSESGKYNVTVGDTIYKNVIKPELGKTYIEITGGEIAHVYGGGNNVTVTENTTICISNESKGINDVLDETNVAGEFKILAKYLDLSTFQGNYGSYDYNHGRVFGGNNKADMAIRPVWNIQRGKIRDLYSGGNEGDMTSPVGLIMDIDPIAANKSELFIYNVYGGCRRADVHPNVSDVTTVQLPTSLGYQFPAGFSARTIIRGGHITNVYGGNDISGRVFGGNAVGIYTTVYGDVYGGGNGSYSYTDNAELGAMTAFRDYYYNPTEVKAKEQAYNDPSFDFSSTDKGVQSVEALNIFRPNAEQVSIRLKGNSESDPTYIKGAVYLGGNSASLSTSKSTQYASGSGPKVEVKIGSYVYANSLFLGNNGANMVTEEILHRYAGYLDTAGNIQDTSGEGRYNFSEMDLIKADIFAKYMEGCAMPLRPSVVFDSKSNGDPADYESYTAYFGSIFCGGNRGSMTWPGTNTINLDKKITVWDKFVGGCNDANIAATAYNAEYLGGMIGTEVEQAPGGMEDEQGNIKDCLIFNFKGLRMEPKRWIDDADPTAGLEWNTYIGENTAEVPTSTGASTEDDIKRRLLNGNIYGGCYNSGHINGNVVINLLEDIVDRDNVFDEVEKENPILGENDSYTITKRNSGVILDEQGMDPLGKALNVFGGGYGPASEVWGSTTINLKSGFTFQIYGGGEKGPIGKSREDAGETAQAGDYVFNNKHYYYDKRYSTYVNLMDTLSAGQANNDVAESIFMYAGSLEAPISGNTRINLGNGRVYDSFGGSCNADILGHAETYVGNGILKDGTTLEGFPYVIDNVYGANDLGGSILGELRAEGTAAPADALTAKADADFTERVISNSQDINKVYLYDADTNPNPRVLTASSYVEYSQGRAVKLFAGSYGDYEYGEFTDYCYPDGKNKVGFTKPREGNAFVNFKPVSNDANHVDEVYGGCEGFHYMMGRDSLLERSYVLVDIPQNTTKYEEVVFFGAGAYSGLGMGIQPEAVKADPDRATAVVDLFRGQIHNVYGGSYNEGVTRRTVVNVPVGSTIALDNIFGGAYGANNIYPCDVYESVVNFRSNDAGNVIGGIYGGNNHTRRTLYSQVNIYAKVWNNKQKTETGYIYGGGLGKDTWVQYTDVNMYAGSEAYRVYGGGNAGRVLNKPSLVAWARDSIDLRIGAGYDGTDGKGYGYEEYDLENGLAKYHELAQDIDAGYIHEEADHGIEKKKFNTNVRIHPGGLVDGYCYGGGYGADAVVSGDTYISLVGGDVKQDIYAGGQSGAVRNLYENPSSQTFTATANAYVKSGTVRNVYGGGWKGDVGYHPEGQIATTSDLLGLSNVVIGNLRTDASFADGDPAIQRSVYGGGEGGSIYGKACLTVNGGHIGYNYNKETGKYTEALDDVDAGDNLLDESGNAFGGGYVANAYVDESYATMYGGIVRGGLYGGGEIGPIGRGALRTDNDALFPPTSNMNHEAKIYKPGSTHVVMYGGHVKRDVFGGGRGFDNWGGDATKYYSTEDRAKMDLLAKGYVFGSTNVSIRGGEIGTPEGVANGYGNVFGGGNIGYVYSGIGRKVGTRQSDEQLVNGMPTNGGGYYYENGDKTAAMTVDCSVDVSPYCMVKADDGITIDGTTYAKGTFVPTEELNKIRNKTHDKAQWDKLDLTGVTIRNAVFAGGNVSVGSDQIYANANTVFGNATAALRDVYHRDLISIGTEHVGGLYGDGNLTFVDGYRELHIGNYGTDYYGLEENIPLEDYRKLNDRERAYFELEFQCQQECTDKNGTSYKVGARLKQEDYRELFEGTEYLDNPAYWVEYGFCSIYAGRLLNTVQRADMVGVFGSRLVLQGARDRVPEKADYTNYTINRVGEVSLNQVRSIAPNEIQEENDTLHGNYFGIYSVVNYLGNLTSDVFMDDLRQTDVSTATVNNQYNGQTYYEWKEERYAMRNRNNGTSRNKVSLASGVYLEIQRESSEGKAEPDWGYVTGVIELDLINVMTGLGGGYVYAKNEHRTKTHHEDWDKVILSPYNTAARTYKKFTYDGASEKIETSGNFIHNTKQIVDDCYPIANKYEGADAVPAHYWYIKGSIYVYDQYISAYTGSATAYSETVSIPLTITAASHGQMTLSDIQPNLYAYYQQQVGEGELQPLGPNDSVMVNNLNYTLNEPITYWEYMQLSESEKRYFVPETYVTIANCKIGDTVYEKGKVMLPEEYNNLFTNDSIYNVDKDEKALFTDIFRPTNNISHDKGYVLTYEVNNPMVWNKWYTSQSNGLTDRLNTDDYNGQSGYLPGPTYSVKAGREGVYGQREYSLSDIITKEVHDTYMRIPDDKRAALGSETQASFEQAFVVKVELTTKNKDNLDQHLYPGSTIAKSDYTEAQWSAIVSSVDSARVVTSTLDLGGGEYIYAGDLLTQADIDDIVARYDDQTDASVKEYLDLAYYCTKGGNYGGSYYTEGVAYRAIDTWCSMSADDRANFDFNYDALDVLLDPTYANKEKQKYQYDSDQFPPRDERLYSGTKPIDYEAVYAGENYTFTQLQEDGVTTKQVTIEKDSTYSRLEYERIPNEKYYYSRIEVTKPGTYYVVKSPFARGERPYAAGEVIAEEVFSSLTDNQQASVEQIEFGSAYTSPKLDGEGHQMYDENGNPEYNPMYYFYCREYYTVGANGWQNNDNTELTVTDVFDSTLTFHKGDYVNQAIVISQENYNNLINLQDKFNIVGNAPVEVSTLYVSRESDINDLSQEKVITVIYVYEYQESDESGTHFTPISEHHVLNIHLQFKSGVPEIGELTKPNTVLPGSAVGMKVPSVTPGAYEVLNSGWEIFSNPSDALSHKNGQPFYSNSTPMYWYQNGYLVAYYAKTYLGKTYSNAVEISVGNYHDIADVMADSIHHMYIDHEDVDRAPKIYIDDETPAAPNAEKSKLDLLKDLYDLTLNTISYDSEHNPEPIGGDGKLKNHSGVNTSMIGAAKNLDIILQSDVSPKAYTEWTPIGDDEEHCFDGTLHGDGYTISGLNNSLFNDLCGEVYNLGVTGSFTSAGLVNTGKGYVENCWVMSSALTVDNNVKAVFGNPTDDKGIQVVNCYYPVSNAYSETEHARGNARKMTEEAFQNGEVTYDLNGFYLQKRYADNKPLTSGTKYSYFAVNGDGSLATEPTTAYYNSDYAIYPLDEGKEKIYGYVENRYADGDFIYADGSVPETVNERYHASLENGEGYYPIWPDDYLFFGQMLTYGHVNNRPYQDEPSHINKSGGRLTTVPTSVNRVYRAPAYFQSKEMGVAHYNPYAIFAAETADKSKEIYPNMTAIDFTGGNGDLAGGFKEGLQSDGKFFPPLLDDDGLTYFGNIDLTRNLLAYVPSATDNDADAESKTNDVVTSYLKDNTYRETNATYRTVAAYDLSQIKGHAVVKTGNAYVAFGNHLLVDKNDFNAPIAYSFDGSSRMWYQRVPDTYVDLTKGWEGISLPFSAELVTTQNKGEITHFYENSKFVDETTKTKVGHEYWLREFKGNVTAPDGEGIATGDFNYPMAGTDGDKEVTNTFLWDYYYKYSSAARQDQNTDTYHQEYYADTRTYSNYAFTEVAKPYIIGFPGVTYYEFDLSGQFVPANTKDGVAELRQQTITFASETGISVAVSDDEIANAKVNEGDYTFCPTYLGKSVPAGTFLLKADGSSYEKQAAEATTVPFRPYFTYQASGARENKVRALAFNRSQKNIGVEDRDPTEGAVGLLNVYAKKGRIVVESTLDAAVDVRIVTTGGNALQTFTIQPGETIETRVSSTGIYIVTASNGQTKKLRVEAR